MTFTSKVTLLGSNRSTGRAYRVKIRMSQRIHGFANLFKLYSPSVWSRLVKKPGSSGTFCKRPVLMFFTIFFNENG